MTYQTYGNSETLVLIINQKDYLLPVINSYNKELPSNLLLNLTKY